MVTVLDTTGLEITFLDNQPFGLEGITFTNQIIKFIIQECALEITIF